MRVLLLGATGNLGSRCLPALLAHKHIVTVLVRNPSKFQLVNSPSLLAQVNAVVEGDATDSALIQKTLLDHDIEGIIDVAGNQVLPWKPYVLHRIAEAAIVAAVAVGKQRGKPLRAWITSAIGVLEDPATEHLFEDYMPRLGVVQHSLTRDVVHAVPLSDLTWSLLAIGGMYPSNPKQGLFEPIVSREPHELLVKAGSPPAWKTTWLERLPFIGHFLNFFYVFIMWFRTKYEDVAEFLAEDLERGSSEWVGKTVGVKEKSKKDV